MPPKRKEAASPENGKKRRNDNYKLPEKSSYNESPSYEISDRIGHFSTDSTNEFCDDDHQLKYLSLPNNLTVLDMDLNEGYDKFNDTYNYEENSFKKLLRWIVSHKEDIQNIFSSQNSSKGNSSKADASKEDSSKGNSSKADASNEDSSKGNPAKADASKEDSSKGKSSKASKEDTSKGNSSKANASKEDLSNRKIDFICTRQVLISIFSTLYEDGEDSFRRSEWMIHATKFRSVIYLRRIQSVEEIQKEKSRDEKIRRNISWGYKFENYITSDSRDSLPDTSRPVNVNEQYYEVLKTKLNDLGILFSAEMDAVDPEFLNKNPKNNSMRCFVEIKTAHILNIKNTIKCFKKKVLKWYLQCYLSGVPRLILGLRNSKGIIKEITKYNVSDLPKVAEDFFCPSVCLNFGYDFLRHVKRTMSDAKDDPEVVYKFFWKPKETEITCEELGAGNAFLPDWYIKEMLSS